MKAAMAYFACWTSSWGTSDWRAFVSSARNCSSIFCRMASASPGSLDRLSCSAKASRSPHRSASAGWAVDGVDSAMWLFLHSHQFELQVLELGGDVERDRARLLHGLPVVARLVDLEVLPAGLDGDLRRRRGEVAQRDAAERGRDQLVHAVARAHLRLERDLPDDLLLRHLGRDREVELPLEETVVAQPAGEERLARLLQRDRRALRGDDGP